MTRKEHRDHAVHLFKVWFNHARKYVSDDVRRQAEAALAGEVPVDCIGILVDIIAQAYKEELEKRGGS